MSEKAQLSDKGATFDIKDTTSYLISGQAALDAIRPLQTYKLSAGDDMLLVDKAEVQTELMMLPSAQQEQRWIPCSESLPEDYVDVLAWFEYYRYGRYKCLYQTYGIGTYSKQYNSWMINHETGWRDLRVIAWMPLPEPYKEDEE